MKKFVAVLLTAAAVLSLAGCGSVPSDEKIKAALEDGTITPEDAKAKGWIDDKWIEEHFEQMEAKSKIYLFDPFNTTYLDGTPASSELIKGTMCLVFFHMQGEETMEKLAVFNELSGEMEEAGVPVLGILMDEDTEAVKESLSEIKFPILIYNDEMRQSLADYEELIGEDLVSVFTKEGGFYTAWSREADADSLLSSAKELADEE